MYEYSQTANTKITGSSTVFKGEGILTSFFIAMDGVNDGTMAIYDGTDSSGVPKIPSNTYDASALGLNGATLNVGLHFKTGLHIEMSGTNFEVVPHIVPINGSFS